MVSKISSRKKAYRQAPEKVRPIFGGTQLLLFGVFDNAKNAKKPTGVTITADSLDGKWSIDIDISDQNDVGNTEMLHKMAFIKIVREIELQVAAIGFDSYGTYEDAKWATAEETFKKEIVAIGVAEGIVSRYTPFVAIDTSDGSKASDSWCMQDQFLPSRLSYAWQALVYDGSLPECGDGDYDSDNEVDIDAGRLTNGFRDNKEQSKPPHVEKDSLEVVVGFQSSNGSFKMEDSFIKAIGLDFSAVKKEASKHGWDATGWATALALTFLASKLADKEDRWKSVATKAKKWLQWSCAKNFETMLTCAKTFFARN